MKGLLIKDFKLLLGQRRFFTVVIIMGLLFLFIYDNPSAAVSYVTMLLAFFTFSTISYDEFDNGMAFLFTLPINRKTYVTEKYVFTGLVSCTSAVCMSAIAILSVNIQKKAADVNEIMAAGIFTILMALVMLAVTLPLQIRFGAEKGRMVMLWVFGAVAAAVVVLGKLFEAVGTDLSEMEVFLSGVPSVLPVLLAVFAAFLVLLISYIICLRVISRKEY